LALRGRKKGPVEGLVYSRKQAAQALGVSLALDRPVVPAIATVKTEWGGRLAPMPGHRAQIASLPLRRR
jgi:hypothetical protein